MAYTHLCNDPKHRPFIGYTKYVMGQNEPKQAKTSQNKPKRAKRP